MISNQRIYIEPQIRNKELSHHTKHINTVMKEAAASIDNALIAT
jgi:hypothetical protein